MSGLYVEKIKSGYVLKSECVVKNKTLYEFFLMDIYENERQLDSGRFRFFSDDNNDLPYVVSVDIYARNGEDLKYKMSEIIGKLSNQLDWFNLNKQWANDDRWSMFVTPHSVNNISVNFRFSNDVIAVFLKMSW